MRKIILIPIMFLLLIMSVMAYEINDTIRINGEYKELGILTTSTANVSIYLPNGLLHTISDMNISGTGLFYYDYIIPNYDGVYDVKIDFYKSSVFQGNETSTFSVGDVNTLTFGTCPSGTQGYVTLIVIFVLLVIMGLIGTITKFGAITFIAAFGLLLMTLIVWKCGIILGIISLLTGLVYLLSGLSLK